MGVKLVWGRQHGVALFGAPMQDSERLRPKRTSQDEATAGTECLSLQPGGKRLQVQVQEHEGLGSS